MAGEYTLTVIVENAQGERAVGSITFTIKAPKEPDPKGVIRVPAQHASIQSAIDAARDGDSIL